MPVKKNKPPQKDRPLTRKQQAFVRHLVENPKDSATKAALEAYSTTPITAATIAHENLRKPQIVSELAKYNNLVENTILNTINDWKDSSNTRQREIAVNQANWVHDKIHGKATQKIEQNSTSVNFNINLSSDEA